MPGPYITDTVIRTALADALGVNQAQFPGKWEGIVSRANVRAAGIIYRALSGRGYTPTQIDTWDALTEYSTDLGLYWSLVGGCGLGTYDDKFVEKFNRIKELETVTITMNGAIVIPGAEDDPNDEMDGGGTVSGGRFSQEGWRINQNTVF